MYIGNDMKQNRKRLTFLLCALLAAFGGLESCSDDSSCNEGKCPESQGDKPCSCEQPGGGGQPGTGEKPCSCEQPGEGCQPGSGEKPCECKPQGGEEPGGEIIDNGKFDITGGRSLKENIVKYYDLAEGQTQPVKSVTMIDFTAKEYKSATSTEHTNRYSRAYKFDYSKNHAYFQVPADISEYSVLTVPVYVPESAVGQTLYIHFDSENESTNGSDYYGALLQFEKAGWTDFEIKLDEMSVARTPRGWDSIDRMIFESTGWDQSNSADTTIYVENLVLRTDPARAQEEDEATTIVDFSEAGYQRCASDEYTKEGQHTCKWEYTKEYVELTLPEDLSPYEAISFWVYVPEESVNQTFYLQVISQNTEVEGDDYYGHMVYLNQGGWNKYTLRLNEFEVARSPRGWNHVDYAMLWKKGFKQANQDSTVIYVDNIVGHTKVNPIESNPIPKLDGVAVSLHSSRAIVDNVLIDNSVENENSTVFMKDGEYWLPLAVFGARYDDAAVYNAKTHSLQMKIDGKVYQFKGSKNTVTIDGVESTLDFTVAIHGDALFAPAHYIKALMHYTEEYVDEMGMIYLSKTPYAFPSLTGRLNTMYETLFIRPNGAEIMEKIRSHWGGDVHPRIMLTQGDFDRLKALIETDDTYASYIDYMIRRYGPESSEFKGAPVVYGLPDGVRLLEISRKARNRIIPWAFLYKVTGQIAYANRIWEEVQALMAFPDWHPAHYLDTAEILYPMAIAFDWLYDAWQPDQRDQMAEAVVKFGMNAGLDRYEGRIRKWERNNWNGVCNGGLTAAALAYIFHPKATEASQKVLNYAIRDVELGLYTYAPDGGYLESTGYWAYGTDYLHVMFSALKSATGTNYGLYHSPGFAHSAYFTTFFENDAGNWAFHDASPAQSDTWTHYWFARESSDSALGRLRRDAIAAKLKSVHFYDAMYYSPNSVGEMASLALDAYYSEVETVTMRDKWDAGSTLTGLHAGYNAQDHGDRDIGNFILFGAGKQFITDLGSEDYNLPDYALRYRKRAEGQNTLVIGDVACKTPDQAPEARAHITKHSFTQDSAYAIVDMLPAYANVTKAHRGLWFTNHRSTVVVQDEVTLPEPQIVRWAAHTLGNIEIAADGRSATIAIDGVDKRLYAEIVSSDTTLKFTSGPAVSYDPAYSTTHSDVDKEYDRSAYSKLMIITPNKVSSFHTAVAFRFVDSGASLPGAGTLYTWTDMDNWK